MTFRSAVVAVGDLYRVSYLFLVSMPQTKSQHVGLTSVWSPSTRLNEVLESPPCLNFLPREYVQARHSYTLNKQKVRKN